MKWIKFLRALLGFVYLFALLSAVASPVYFFMASEKLSFTFNIGGFLVRNIHWSFYVVLSLAIISQFLFVYMIYHLKKASWLLTPRKVFDGGLNKHLYAAGIVCVLGAILNRVPAFLYKYINFQELRDNGMQGAGFDFGFSFDSMLVIIVFGVFLIVLSKIIALSASFKQENDLTI